MTSSSRSLTKYPLASLREVASLSFSFAFILFSGCIMGFCDRIILARYSLEALEASTSAFFLVQLFQISTIRIITVAQMYVAQYKGANKESHMGPIIWQMIWLSLFLMLFILPISFPISHLYFKNSSIQKDGLSYFQMLIQGNFLFTIAAALSCFYLGQGKSKKLLLTSILSQIINLFLDLLFVFGIKGWIAPMGAKGAALASVIAETIFCVILFSDFLQEKYRLVFGTGNFAFKRSLFLKSLKLGLSRGIAKFISLLAWIAISYVILQKTKPEYLAILTFGSSLLFFTSCMDEGIWRCVNTIGGYIIGAKKDLFWQLVRSSILFVVLLTILFAIPSLIFRDSLISLFFKSEPRAFLKQELYLSLYWIVFHFFAVQLTGIGLGLISSYGDPKFHMICSSLSAWIGCLVPVYFVIGKWNMLPHTIWIITTCHCFLTTIIYFLRFRQEKWKTTSIVPETPLPE